MAGKIAVKGLILLLVVAGLNLIYAMTLYDKDLREKSPEIVQIRETSSSTDIYYFGESSNVTFAKDDTTQKSISELTADKLPGLRLTNVNKYATHAGIYAEWLGSIDLKEARLKAVVVTMNLRSFDATWIHSELETPLRESLVMARPLPPLLNRFMLALQAFDNKTTEQREKDMRDEWETKKIELHFPYRQTTVAEWDRAMAEGGYLKPDGSWDMQKIVLACHYIKSYAFNIDESNPRVRDFDRISEWGEKNHVPIIFNLMAENVQFADSLVGRELVFLMRQNRAFLLARYNHGNCRVVDNLETVNGKEFIDKDWTTEHYNQAGRMRIAANLAATLKSVTGVNER